MPSGQSRVGEKGRRLGSKRERQAVGSRDARSNERRHDHGQGDRASDVGVVFL